MTIEEIPREFIELLEARGIHGTSAINKFLLPRLTDLPRPSRMKNLESAAQLILDHIECQKQIVVWGDYDVDGTTATSLLVNFFQQLEISVIWHIPNRFDEGYGLNMEWFFRNRELLGRDFLVITVDCGISEKTTVESIKNFGGTVVVTDHHAIPPEGGPHCLVINPSQSDCGFHGETLAGVGVAFYLTAALRAEMRDRGFAADAVEMLNLKQYLPFVALGTIADVVSLSPTNRILVRAGLEAMQTTVFPGVTALLRSCEIAGDINSEDIGFLLGPKINAAGRLGEGELVVELLTEKNQRKASIMAQRLTRLNNDRKALCEENLELALDLMEEERCSSHNKIIILVGEFHLGVAGIVAAKLVERFGVPAIVLGQKNDGQGRTVFTGSARSIDSVDIVKCLSNCEKLLERYGGHKMAAGLSISPEKYETFCVELAKIVKNTDLEGSTSSKEGYDLLLSAEKLLSPEYIRIMKLFEPFGPGNEMPVFYDSQATIFDARRVGRNAEHLQVAIRGQYANIKGIGFSLGEKISSIQSMPIRKIYYTPTINRFRGTTSWQIRIIDL